MKEIKVSVTPDRASFKQVADLFDGMTRSVERFKRALDGVAGGSGVSVSRAVGLGGNPPPAPAAAFAVGRKGGGVVSNILGVDDPSKLQGMARGVDQLFSTTTQRIRAFTQQAQASMQQLGNQVQQFNSKVAAGGGGPAAPGGPSRSWTSGATAGVPWTMGTGSFPPPIPAAARAQPLVQPHLPPGPAFGGIRQLAATAVQQGGNLVGLPGAGSFGSSLLLGGGAAALGGAAIVGAVAAGVALTNARQDNIIANMGFGLGEPVNVQSRLTQMAGPAADMFHAARSGNVIHGMAYARALNRNAAMEAIMRSDAQAELQRRQANLEGGTVRVLHRKVQAIMGTPGEGSEPWKMFSRGLGAWGLDKAMGILDPAGNVSRRRTDEIEKEKIDRGIAAGQAQRIQQLTGEETATRARLDVVAQEIRSGWRRQLDLRRVGGIGFRPEVDPSEGMLRLDAKLLDQGWNVSDYAHGNRQAMGIGMGYVRHLGGTFLPSMHYGGAVGVEGIVKAAGMLGGSVSAGVHLGAGKGGGGGLQQMIGGGGLDALAGSELVSQLYQRALASGSQFGYSGNAASQFVRAGAGLVYGGGLDVAQQQARSAMLQQGLGAVTGFNQGTTAPLYMAASTLNWIKASGGYSPLNDALRGLGSEALIGIARGGKVPEHLAALAGPGQNVSEIVKRGVSGMLRAPFFETIDSRYAGTKAGEALKRIRFHEDRGGSYFNYLDEQLAGLKGKARGERLSVLNQTLGAMAVGGPEALLALEAADHQYAPFLKAGGVGAVGPRGSEAAAARSEADQKRADADALKGGNLGQAIRAIEDLFKQGGAGEKFLSSIQDLKGIGGTTTTQEMQVFAKSVTIATDSINSTGGGPARVQ